MTLNDVVMILLTIIGVTITGIAAFFVSEFKEMRLSVDSLNLKVGEVLIHVGDHEKRIERLEENS